MAIVTLILYTTALVGLTYLVKYFFQKLRLYHAAKDLPGPKALPIFGNALMFTGNVTEMCNKVLTLADTYPSLFRIWMGPRLAVVIQDPEYMKAIYNSPSAVHKSEDYECMKPLLGDGLLCAPASTWRVHRKSLSPAFNSNALKSFMNAFNRNTNIFVQKLEATNGEEVDVYERVAACALDIIYETAMEIQVNVQDDMDRKLAKTLRGLMEIITQRLFKLWLRPEIIFSKTAAGKEQKEGLRYMNDLTTKVISKTKMKLETGNVEELGQEKQKPKLFIDLLVELSRNGGKMSDTILRDEINTMAVAGSDTTSSTVTFLFLMLATFPEIQNKVYQELYKIYGTSDPEDVPMQYNDLQHMDYFDRVSKETMRLFPVAPLVLRQVVEDIKVENNRTIPSGSTAILGIFKLHRNPKYWPDPLKFDPDRFLPENIAVRHPYSYVPFSGGPRNCIGAKYAVMEIKAIVGTVLRKFIIAVDKPVPIEEIELQIYVALKPVNPVRLRFKKRY